MTDSRSWQPALWLLAAVACWSCGTEQGPEVHDAQSSEPQLSEPQSLEPQLIDAQRVDMRMPSAPIATHTLRWQTEVTLRPQGFERVAEGPSAVAVASHGRLLLLDRLAGRVLRIDARGRASTLSEVAIDSQDLAARTGGGFVTHSAVRATAWFFDARGRESGKLSTPRSLRELRGIEWSPNGMLWGHTAYQERFRIGTSERSLPLAAVLASKREGAVLLDDGQSANTIVIGDHAVLQLLSEPHVLSEPQEARRTTIAKRIRLPHATTASRIVGAHASTVCLRTEHVSGRPSLRVTRRLLCVDVVRHAVVLDVDLGEPGLYLPHRELAVGAGSVAHILPQSDGLLIRRWSFSP
jgi:hypothetical protein